MIITPRIPGTHAGKEPYRSFLSPRRRRQPLDPCLSSSRSSEVKEIINVTNLSSDKNGDLNISKKKYSPGPLACRDRGTFHLNISLSLLPARSESWLHCRNYNKKILQDKKDIIGYLSLTSASSLGVMAVLQELQ